MFLLRSFLGSSSSEINYKEPCDDEGHNSIKINPLSSSSTSSTQTSYYCSTATTSSSASPCFSSDHHYYENNLTPIIIPLHSNTVHSSPVSSSLSSSVSSSISSEEPSSYNGPHILSSSSLYSFNMNNPSIAPSNAFSFDSLLNSEGYRSSSRIQDPPVQLVPKVLKDQEFASKQTLSTSSSQSPSLLQNQSVQTYPSPSIPIVTSVSYFSCDSNGSSYTNCGSNDNDDCANFFKHKDSQMKKRLQNTLPSFSPSTSASISPSPFSSFYSSSSPPAVASSTSSSSFPPFLLAHPSFSSAPIDKIASPNPSTTTSTASAATTDSIITTSSVSVSASASAHVSHLSSSDSKNNSSNSPSMPSKVEDNYLVGSSFLSEHEFENYCCLYEETSKIESEVQKSEFYGDEDSVFELDEEVR